MSNEKPMDLQTVLTNFPRLVDAFNVVVLDLKEAESVMNEMLTRIKALEAQATTLQAVSHTMLRSWGATSDELLQEFARLKSVLLDPTSINTGQPPEELKGIVATILDQSIGAIEGRTLDPYRYETDSKET